MEFFKLPMAGMCCSKSGSFLSFGFEQVMAAVELHS
ncbi:unnamed protein product [Lactuca saligna]|uniref:Uncharacterized protein n=1 Tax=Lactuca saligna TaxID=75948 RepID=A0AA35V6C4_LACSI|nr:unnamed protein product [Lactuca saligna]